MNFLKPFIKYDVTYVNSSQKIVPLDGLRGLAVVLVVFFHCFEFLKISYIGWIGVDLFFVLSGFLITGILIDGKQKANYYKNFFGKRVLRIFPLYYLALLIITFLAVVNPFNDIAINIPNIYYWLYIQNWQITFSGKLSLENPLLSHFWSLAVEEQFYIFWPFIIKNCKIKTLPFVILFFVIVSIILRTFLFTHNNVGYYVNTFSRFDALCIGSLGAVFIRYRKDFLKNYLIYIFIASGLFIILNAIISGPHFSHAITAKIGYTVNALFWISLLLYSISGTTFLSTVFSLRFFTFFGKYSYGMYVYHAIIYLIFTARLFKALSGHGLNVICCLLLDSSIIVLASILVSILSYNLFEKRFLKYKKHFEPKSHPCVQSV